MIAFQLKHRANGQLMVIVTLLANTDIGSFPSLREEMLAGEYVTWDICGRVMLDNMLR